MGSTLCQAGGNEHQHSGEDNEDEDDGVSATDGRPLRVERLLANLGYGKRKECQALVRRGRVTRASSGKPIRVGDKVCHHEVLLDGEPLDPAYPMVILLHKPVGYVVTSPEDERILDPKVYDLLPFRFGQRRPFLSCVGRLDKDTSGLLLLTDDGQLLHRITSPRKGIWKRYRATLAKPLTGAEAAAVVRKFGSGTLVLTGDRTPLLPAGLQMVDDVTAEVALCEGRYHQIRRMFGSQGHEVVSLHRHTVGGLDLAGLDEGDWRYATEDDVQAVFSGPDLDVTTQQGQAQESPTATTSSSSNGADRTTADTSIEADELADQDEGAGDALEHAAMQRRYRNTDRWKQRRTLLRRKVDMLAGQSVGSADGSSAV